MESLERPFAELPTALVEQLLQNSQALGQKLRRDFEYVRTLRQEWRKRLEEAGWLHREAELPYTPIPTSCGVDGSYAVERLLASDLVAAAAVAVEGLTPPSETRYWPDPRHSVWIEVEPHEAETSAILRAVMMGMELKLAAQAPHEVVFLDGSLTTPFIYFNQALNKSQEVPHLAATEYLRSEALSALEAYAHILASTRVDRSWIAIPKYTVRREVGQAMQWPEKYDDKGLLSFLLEPGEYISPRLLEQPARPWHLNLAPLDPAHREKASRSVESIIGSLNEIHVVYYRPYPWLPALRIEMGRAVAQSQARLAIVLHAVRHQCGAPAVLEPYPLYMADRMVKHLPEALPTLRQIISQYVAETYLGDLTEVFLGLHGYRTESGA